MVALGATVSPGRRLVAASWPSRITSLFGAHAGIPCYFYACLVAQALNLFGAITTLHGADTRVTSHHLSYNP